jgi:conjugative relaxase-like TrwC/TraI family protein
MARPGLEPGTPRFSVVGADRENRQLHTHVVANMTRAEGRWSSLEAHELYEHKSAAGALCRAVLRAEVRERLPWLWWRSAGRGLFEIEDVPQWVLREFARRRMEIEERARELTGVAASQLSREGITLPRLAGGFEQDLGEFAGVPCRFVISAAC